LEEPGSEAVSSTRTGSIDIDDRNVVDESE
jgi:hypothetical protein